MVLVEQNESVTKEDVYSYFTLCGKRENLAFEKIWSFFNNNFDQLAIFLLGRIEKHTNKQKNIYMHSLFSDICHFYQ